jgi:cytosine/adenosine deaminase-related metal-dependent hydrolase
VISFLEMTGVKSRRQPKMILKEAVEHLESLPVGRCDVGLSPHAAYSTAPELVCLSAEMARQRKWPIAIHVAESSQEFEMFTRGQGEMYDWLRRNQRDMSDCGLGSPIQHLERCGALHKNLLAIHVNYIDEGDDTLLAGHKVNVVHCPRSHAYFGHKPFPFQRLAKAGLNLCLGTDSLASVYKIRKETVELNLFEEMRTFAKNFPSEDPRTILEMVTVNAAHALGLKGAVGELSEGAFADVIAIPFVGKTNEVYEAALHHKGDVSASMIDGRWAIPPEAA